MTTRSLALDGLIALALVAMSARTAAAQAVGDESHPTCATLDRADGQDRAGVDIAYPWWKHGAVSPDARFTSLWLSAWGQYLDRHGRGGYLVLPVSYALVSPDGTVDGADDTSLGDPEVGAVYRIAESGRALALHLGVTLPAAPESSIAPARAAVDGLAAPSMAYAQPNDLVQSAPRQSFVRMGAVGRFRSGALFARADLGLDVRVYSGLSVDTDAPSLGRFNLAGGMVTDRFVLLGELVNTIDLEQIDRGEAPILHWATLSALFPTGRVEPQLAFTAPLDEPTQHSLHLVATVGVRARLD